MRTNTRENIPKIYTREGAPARHINHEQQLRRLVLSCLLWEREFYESGVDIATRIAETAKLCDFETVARLAMEARQTHGLRHVPLLLLLDLIRRGGPRVSNTIALIIGRADEMAELISLYWRYGKKPLSKQMKIGLAACFEKFNEYQLAKYDRDGPVRIRDVMFMCHPKPRSQEQVELFKRVANQELKTPDTWEVGLSGGGDKHETFERLIREEKLGYLAVLRNLRNMMDAGCDTELVKSAILDRRGAKMVFPFRYIAAARAFPQLEPVIDQALIEAVGDGSQLNGKTIVLVDVSGSMTWPLSERSDLSRLDAAAALASVLNGDIRTFTFSNDVVEVPTRSGMAGIDAITKSQRHMGTALGGAITVVNNIPHDRLIVITDEQSRDRVPDPICKNAYMINVASNQNGVGYGKWKHIDGFSEAVIRWITEIEASDDR